MTLIEKVCLYYREGASDKVYEIHLTQEETEEGFRVTGYNGRRGTKLVAQSKTERPVPYRTARYIFDNLEAAKRNHRRTPYRVASREPATNVSGSGGETEAASCDANAKQEVESSAPQHQDYSAPFLDALEL